MAKGGRVGGGNRRRGQGQPGAARVEKQRGNAAGATKPMELDDKMAVSLDDIIKRDKGAKRAPSLGKSKQDPKRASNESKDSTGGKNSNGSKQPPKRQQRQNPPKNSTSRRDSRKPSHDLRITVNSRMIKDRPILNQIISNAELTESQRASRNVSSRLQERVQPVSLDYRVAPEGRSKNYASAGRPGHHAQPYSHQSRPPPPAPMHIDTYYHDNLGDRHQYSDSSMRRRY